MNRIAETRKLIVPFLEERGSAEISAMKKYVEESVNISIKNSTFYNIIRNLKKEGIIIPCKDKGVYCLKKEKSFLLENEESLADSNRETRQREQKTEKQEERKETEIETGLAGNLRRNSGTILSGIGLKDFAEQLSRVLVCEKEFQKLLNAQVIVKAGKETKELYQYSTILEQIVGNMEQIRRLLEEHGQH